MFTDVVKLCAVCHRPTWFKTLELKGDGILQCKECGTIFMLDNKVQKVENDPE